VQQTLTSKNETNTPNNRTGSHVQKGHKMTNSELTISVPEAGQRFFGLSRNGSYAAASRGDIPTVKIGRLLRVPVRALERMLDRASERPA
jgi:hypothetical protein